jgi:alpha-L-rhamnosidase
VQVSYRIVLSVVAGLTPKAGVMWDSGEVASGATHLIGYPADASPLRSDTRYYWVVRCSLDDGTKAESATAASFTTGLFAPSDWLATWIRTDAAIGAPLFRREFTLPAPHALHALHTPHAPWAPNSTAAAAAPPRVTLFVAGIGYNEVLLNGSNLHSHTSSPPPLPCPSTRTPYPPPVPH